MLFVIGMVLAAPAPADPPPPPTMVSLEANATSVTVPAEIELEATTDESLTNTGYSIVLINEDNDDDQMSSCVAGTTCGASDWVIWAENPDPQPRHFRAELRHAGTVVASDHVVVDVVAAEWSVSLEASSASVTVPAEIGLEATANRPTSGTGYSIKIIDENDAREMNGWCAGATCGASEWVTWAENHDPQPHHYRAEIRHSSTGTVVASDEVVVDVVAAEWSVSLEASATAVTVPAEIELEATPNRSTTGTGYSTKILDENDDDRVMSAVCSGGTCGASEWVTWAENPDPQPHHYRAEIRHSSTGTVVASHQIVVDVMPFTFNANLAFSVVSGVNKATGTATPSVSGTGYSVRVKRLDGTQMCSGGSSGCTATVAVGGTYRTTVENGTGHIAGQTSWWTLTPSGPEEEKADDLDLIPLAALYASPSAVCSHVLLYPGTHLGGSSVSDQYLACEAAVLEGKTTLGVLRAIVAAGGGSAVLWYLHEQVTEETTPPDPSDEDDEIDDPTPAPPPIAWPVTLQDDIDQLMTQNPQLTSPAMAATVLKTCQRAVLRAGLATDDCLDLPIFASGDLDVPQPTQHDRESLAVRPQWVLLNYGTPIGAPSRQWYEPSPQCPSPRPPGQDCHEYPFFTTKQGGPNVAPLPRLKLVASGQNRAQGSFYRHFAVECLGQVERAVPERSDAQGVRDSYATVVQLNAGDGNVSMLDSDLLARLEAAWAEQGAPIVGALAPGLPEAEMDEITRPLGLRLPVEARVWWGWHDGVPSDPGVTTPGRWMGPVEYQPLRDAVKAYLEDRAIFTEVMGDPEPYRPKGYFPITRSSGPILCDCSVPEGSPTPIYYAHTHDSQPENMQQPVVQSFGEMVTWWIEALNDRIWSWNPEREAWDYDFRRLDPARGTTGLV